MKLLGISILNWTPDAKFKNASMHSDTLLLEMITADEATKQEDRRQTWQKAMRGENGITHLGIRVRDLDTAVSKLKLLVPGWSEDHLKSRRVVLR